MRKVLPITLILSLAAFGCTMNRTPGNGQPVTATPSMSPAATPGSSYGNVPMASSYTVPTTNTRLSADDAAAIMREHQAYRGRFLGYLNPTPQIRQPVQQYDTAQSSLYSAPQVTVNSSISSPPTPVISSGAVTGAGTVTTAPAGTAGTFVLPGGTATTPTAGTTATGSIVTPGAFAATGASTLTPTVSSGAVPSPNVAASSVATPTTTTTPVTAASTATPAQATTQMVIPASTPNAAPITVSNTSGQIVISNVKSK